MSISHLEIYQFKNHKHTTFTFGKSKIVCFVGENGVGKTNILDAIYYLCLGKSFFSGVEKQNIFDYGGCDFFRLKGIVENNPEVHEIKIIYEKGKKKQLWKNGVLYEKNARHVGKIPVVMIAPIDHVLITGGGEYKRKWMNMVISQVDADYLDTLMAYNQTLKQRNALLKQQYYRKNTFISMLTAYNHRLVNYGNIIFEKRRMFIDFIVPLIKDMYNIVSNQKEQIDIRYQSELLDRSFKDILNESTEKDRILQRTTSGVHRDDLLFNIDGESIKRYGSQGQQKSFLVALKMGQFFFLNQKKKTIPILLIDDFFDKLDIRRAKNVLRVILEKTSSQVFITDTDLSDIKDILRNYINEVRWYNVLPNGKVDLQTSF